MSHYSAADKWIIQVSLHIVTPTFLTPVQSHSKGWTTDHNEYYLCKWLRFTHRSTWPTAYLKLCCMESWLWCLVKFPRSVFMLRTWWRYKPERRGFDFQWCNWHNPSGCDLPIVLLGPLRILIFAVWNLGCGVSLSFLDQSSCYTPGDATSRKVAGLISSGVIDIILLAALWS